MYIYICMYVIAVSSRAYTSTYNIHYTYTYSIYNIWYDMIWYVLCTQVHNNGESPQYCLPPSGGSPWAPLEVAPQFWAAQPVSQRIDSSKHFLKRSHWQPWRWWGDNGTICIYILHNIYTLLHNSIHKLICKWYNSDIYIYIIFIHYMYIHYIYTEYIYIHNIYT